MDESTRVYPCYVTDRTVIEHTIFSQSGRPKTGQLPECYEYRPSSNISSLLDVRAEKLLKKGMLILATKDISNGLTMEKTTILYITTECREGFSVLTTPDFLTS